MFLEDGRVPHGHFPSSERHDFSAKGLMHFVERSALKRLIFRLLPSKLRQGGFLHFFWFGHTHKVRLIYADWVTNQLGRRNWLCRQDAHWSGNLMANVWVITNVAIRNAVHPRSCQSSFFCGYGEDKGVRVQACQDAGNITHARMHKGRLGFSSFKGFNVTGE